MVASRISWIILSHILDFVTKDKYILLHLKCGLLHIESSLKELIQRSLKSMDIKETDKMGLLKINLCGGPELRCQYFYD